MQCKAKVTLRSPQGTHANASRRSSQSLSQASEAAEHTQNSMCKGHTASLNNHQAQNVQSLLLNNHQAPKLHALLLNKHQAPKLLALLLSKHQASKIARVAAEQSLSTKVA